MLLADNSRVKMNPIHFISAVSLVMYTHNPINYRNKLNKLDLLIKQTCLLLAKKTYIIVCIEKCRRIPL